MTTQLRPVWGWVNRSAGALWHGRSLSAATAQGVIVNALVLVCNFFNGVILARALGAEGRGVFTAVLLVPSIVAAFASAGTGAGYTYWSRRYPETARELFGAGLVTQLILGVLAGCLGTVLAPYWLSDFDPKIVRFAQVFAWTTVLSLLNGFLASVFAARGEFRYAGGVGLGVVLLFAASLTGLRIADALEPVTALLVRPIGGIIVTLISLVYLWRQIRPRFSAPIPPATTMLSFGIRGLPGRIANRLGQDFDKLLILGFLSIADLGRYSVAFNVAGLAWALNSALAGVLFPKLAGLPDREIIVRMQGAGGGSVLVTSLMALPLMIAAPFMIPRIYGEEFRGLGLIVALLALRQVAFGYAQVLLGGMNALGKPGTASTLQIVNVAATIILLLLCVPILGMTGAALGLLLGGIVAVVATSLAYPLLLKQPLPRPAKPRNLLRRLGLMHD